MSKKELKLALERLLNQFNLKSHPKIAVYSIVDGWKEMPIGDETNDAIKYAQKVLK
jgi:hypothetical protein